MTTVYVIATTSFSGILRTRDVPALIPIGLLSGLSAVVCLLLIVAVANNKIQGLAMVRALGMLIAGLPCLPWFIDSAWSLAFGVLPPYWAAKAFWVASDHGAWWPYLVGGVIFNVAIAWLLFRRFLARTPEGIGLVDKVAQEVGVPRRTGLSSERSRATQVWGGPVWRRT